MNTPTLQDFSLIRTKTEKKKEDLLLRLYHQLFISLVIDLILGLQDDEIRDCITDSNFLRISKQTSGHDRGIDALYIDENFNSSGHTHVQL